MADYTAQQSPDVSEAMVLLSKKRSALNAPGTRLSSLYYGVANATVDAVECTYNVGRFTSDLSSLAFGSGSQVLLSNQSFVGQTWLHFELPNLFPGQTLSRGWGYGIIRALSYIFGSSNVSQTTFDGQSLWHCVSMQCETSEKRSELFRLGGQEYLGPIMRIGANGQPERDSAATLTATILLPLPWSTAAGLIHKKSFDTSLLSNPIAIQVQINQAGSVFGGLEVPNPFPTALLQAKMIFRQGQLTAQNMSLRRVLMDNPDEQMPYPFIYSQSAGLTQFQGSNLSSSPINLNLTGFINADLVAMTISVVRLSSLSPPANGAPNWHQSDDIQNVTLDYNGTTIFAAPRRSWRAMTANSTAGAQYFHNSLIQVVGPLLPPPATNSFTSVAQDCYDLHIDFSQIRSMVFEGMFQNVWRIGSQTMNLKFNTEGDSTVQYQPFITFHYNAVAGVQQGQTALYF